MAEIWGVSAFNRKAATVFIQDGDVKLMLPSGDVLDMVTDIKVIQGIEGHAKADISCFVNVCSTAEEAKNKYGAGDLVTRVSGRDLVAAYESQQKTKSER